MEIQELRVLVAIVEMGGFKKAAGSLFLTQSAVSQSLANLERKIGERLVERTTPVRPTVIGGELLNKLQSVSEHSLRFCVLWRSCKISTARAQGRPRNLLRLNCFQWGSRPGRPLHAWCNGKILKLLTIPGEEGPKCLRLQVNLNQFGAVARVQHRHQCSIRAERDDSPPVWTSSLRI